MSKARMRLPAPTTPHNCANRAPACPPPRVTAQAAQMPADAHSIDEMIRLMDANKDGCIGWDEFQAFMTEVRCRCSQPRKGGGLLCVRSCPP